MHGSTVRLFLLLIATTAAGVFIDVRSHRAGGWLPPVPRDIGVWRGTDLNEDASLPEKHRYLSRIYRNPFGEAAKAFIMAADSVEIYNDPRGCMRGQGYAVTAEREIALGPGARARALVLRNADVRIIMFYWNQYRDGGTSTDGPLYRDALGRMSAAKTTLWNVLTGKQTCIVRVFAAIDDMDADGAQAFRNVQSLSQVVYKSLLRGR